MSDFIDDTPVGEEEDYSSIIREIFGYDRRKYIDDDFDDSNMEASYAEVMKEEKRSARIGLMEDLEDMRKEAEEKKRKKQLKMKKETKR
ncbi:protein SPT2 homolog [Tachypleus tridentatus]